MFNNIIKGLNTQWKWETTTPKVIFRQIIDGKKRYFRITLSSLWIYEGKSHYSSTIYNDEEARYTNEKLDIELQKIDDEYKKLESRKKRLLNKYFIRLNHVKTEEVEKCQQTKKELFN